ncbi:CYTH and CHAD domain-containing protein [Mycolicibacterium stellerae]|uniref:CYTH and CHAD domain-containing protein n=1 Tax=Mycolicibacterium stellerae TaxID=2358193 RepID=UPI003898F8BC
MSSRAPATTRHLEVERKFDVVESTPAPSFDGLAPVARVSQSPAQTLDAVYFDTAGRDLAAHRITLRRRTGGTDAGWHLKLPVGPDARTEIRAQLGESGDDNVPPGLRDVVLAIARDRPLVPVAHICTTRIVHTLYDANDAALAEFADDRVTASAGGTDTEQQWREWELELAEHAASPGSADEHTLTRLSRRLLDAGAVPAGHASKLARTLGSSVVELKSAAVEHDSVHQAVAEQIEALLEWDRALRSDSPDSVHQVRVTIRQIRSLVQASPAAFGLSEDAQILDELRDLAAVLGTARDAEVLGDRYTKALDALPQQLVRGPIRSRLVDGARDRYRSGWQASLAVMRSEHYFRLLDGLDALVAAEALTPTPGARQLAEATIADGYKHVRKRVKAAAAADAGDHDLALHQIRKSAKRLRYTAAATGQMKVSEAAKEIQTLLGDHQDSVVSRVHLAEQANEAHTAGEDTFTYGLLYHQEADLAAQCEQQLHTALKSLDKAVHKALRRRSGLGGSAGHR